MLGAFDNLWVQLLLLSFFGLGITWPFVFLYVVVRALRDLRAIRRAAERIADTRHIDRDAAQAAPPSPANHRPGRIALSQFGR